MPAKWRGKKIREVKGVINGAGAAGTAIAKMLLCIGQDEDRCTPVKEIIVCDSKGIISNKRMDISTNTMKMELAGLTNKNTITGTLAEAIRCADVFIGVSVAGGFK